MHAQVITIQFASFIPDAEEYGVDVAATVANMEAALEALLNRPVSIDTRTIGGSHEYDDDTSAALAAYWGNGSGPWANDVVYVSE